MTGLDDDLWTVEDAAAEVNMTPAALYTWVRRGYLSYAPGKRGRHKLVRLADVFKAEAARQHEHRRHSE